MRAADDIVIFHVVLILPTPLILLTVLGHTPKASSHSNYKHRVYCPKTVLLFYLLGVCLNRNGMQSEPITRPGSVDFGLDR